MTRHSWRAQLFPGNHNTVLKSFQDRLSVHDNEFDIPVLYRKTEIIKNLARMLEFPLLVRSVSRVKAEGDDLLAVFCPLIQTRKFWTSWRHSQLFWFLRCPSSNLPRDTGSCATVPYGPAFIERKACEEERSISHGPKFMSSDLHHKARYHSNTVPYARAGR